MDASEEEMVPLEALAISSQVEKPAPVPVTILSGFLGAGKTTLLNYILKENHGKRIAVIENEFGDEIGIESLIAKDSVSNETFDEFYSLPNGCICCSVKDELINTLERLIATQREKFDYILVETTGLANPGSLASIFWVDEELDSRIYLDGIVTVVDAKNILKQLEQEPPVEEAVQQIAYADCVLLNKKDLLAPESLEEEQQHLEEKLNRINPYVNKHWTIRSQVASLDLILNLNAFNIETQKPLKLMSSPALEDAKQAMTMHTKKLVTQVSSVCISTRKVLDDSKVNAWIGDLLWEKCKEEETLEIYRIKGILQVGTSPHQYLLQGVQDLFECIETHTPWPNADARETQIIFIGKGLNASVLQEALEACSWDTS